MRLSTLTCENASEREPLAPLRAIWKACWVKALGGSNPPSSAGEGPVTCDFVGGGPFFVADAGEAASRRLLTWALVAVRVPPRSCARFTAVRPVVGRRAAVALLLLPGPRRSNLMRSPMRRGPELNEIRGSTPSKSGVRCLRKRDFTLRSEHGSAARPGRAT